MPEVPLFTPLGSMGRGKSKTVQRTNPLHCFMSSLGAQTPGDLVAITVATTIAATTETTTGTLFAGAGFVDRQSAVIQ